MSRDRDPSEPPPNRRERAEGATRILYVLPYAPRLDARHGGKTVAQLLVRLDSRFRVAIAHLARPGEHAAEEIGARADVVEPVSVTDPGDGSRRRRAVRIAAGLARRTPLQVSDFASRELEHRLAELAARWQPDVVHVELEAMAGYLRIFDGQETRRLLVLPEPAGRTADELRRSGNGVERLVRRLDAFAWRAFDRDVAGKADAVVVLTEADRDAVARITDRARTHVIPLGAELDAPPLDPLGTPPPGILFFGGFGHAPNVDAAERLAKRIFPTVAARVADAQLYLVGERPPPAVTALAGPRILVTGAVPDVRPYLDDAAVVAAPIAVGGGMRLKVLEALAAGKAIVATPRAVEGLPLRSGEHAVVAESDEALAAAIIELLEVPDDRRRLAVNARAWAEENLDLRRSTAAYERLYDELAGGRARK
jgi:glycosyltransferase involved in cell wall biosynthesis